MTLEKLYKIIEDRKNKMPKDSYTTSLFKEGKNKIIQKVVEESGEVIYAVEKESKKRVVSEIADLIFHLLVMMSFMRISPSDILDELDKRNTNREVKEDQE